MDQLEFGPESFKVSVPGYTILLADSEGYKQFIAPSLSLGSYSSPSGKCHMRLLIFTPGSPKGCRTFFAMPKSIANDTFKKPKEKWLLFNARTGCNPSGGSQS